MGTKKRPGHREEDSRTTQNGAGRNSAKTRPDFQSPVTRAAANGAKSRKESHSGHGGGAPGVLDAPEAGRKSHVRRKHTKPKDQQSV
jgi:hypothetical protein